MYETGDHPTLPGLTITLLMLNLRKLSIHAGVYSIFANEYTVSTLSKYEIYFFLFLNIDTYKNYVPVQEVFFLYLSKIFYYNFNETRSMIIKSAPVDLNGSFQA